MDTGSKGRPSPDDETEDSEEEAGPSRGYLRQDARSDRSITEDEDELPPVRRPIAFTIKKPDPEPEWTPDEDVEMDEPLPAQPARIGGRTKSGGGKGKKPAPPPTSRGTGRVTRSKPQEPSPSPPPSPPANDNDETGDSEDEEL
jgi:ribose 5-phosphate isomerase A